MTVMTEVDYATVQAFAAGDRSLRETVLDIYQRCYSSAPNCLYMRFLSETFNSVPDYSLRGLYRARIIDGQR